MNVKRPSSLGLLSSATVVAFFIVALVPVIAVVAASFRRDGHFSIAAYRSVLTESRQWSLMATTLTIAAGTAALATLLGGAAAFALEYLRAPGRRWLSRGIVIPLLLPPYIGAIALADLLGSGGLLRYGLDAAQQTAAPWFAFYTSAGVILVLTFSYFPIVTLVVGAHLRRCDRRLEDPARMAASSWRTFAAIALPPAYPAIATGGIIVFLLSLVEFAVPSLLQVNVYTVEIYSRFSAGYDIGEAVALAMPLVAIGGVGVALLARLQRKRKTAAHSNPEPPIAARSKTLAWLGTALCIVVIGCAGAMPLLVLIRRGMPLTSYAEVWRTAHEEIVSSMTASAVAATVLTILAFAMACLGRARRKVARLFNASLLPFLISGPVFGVGLIAAWNHAGPPSWVYDTPAILVLAYVGRDLFFAWIAVVAALAAIPRKYEEAAAVSGASWRRTLFGILLPLSWPMLAGVWGLGFLLSLRELDTAVLVAPPGWNPLAVRLFSLMHYGPSSFVAALSVTTAAIILAIGAATAWVSRVRPVRTDVANDGH